MRGEPGTGGAAGGASGIDLTGGAGTRSAAFPSACFTKMRVNSPGADAAACFGSTDGTGACAVAGGCGTALADWPAWNNFVNSPGAPCGAAADAYGDEENAGSAGHGACFASGLTTGSARLCSGCFRGCSDSLGSVSSAMSRHHSLESLHGLNCGVKGNDAAVNRNRKRGLVRKPNRTAMLVGDWGDFFLAHGPLRYICGDLQPIPKPITSCLLPLYWPAAAKLPGNLRKQLNFP